jgi:hypothetical protein
MRRELLAPFEKHEIECLLGAQILVDQLLDLPQQLRVLEDRQLHVKDRGFLGAGVLFGASSDLVKPVLGFLDCRAKALDLGGYPFVGDNAMANIRDFPNEKVDWSVHDPR